ncbi:MAG: AAA family ATPase [Candidatus Bathyarchaeota archaeon]
MKTLVTIGRGGTGKTSFVTLMAKYFINQGDTPMLLVDVDPDQNLGEMIGANLEEEEKRTISELVMETFLERGGTTVGVPPTERIESRIWENGLYEGDDFDFMAIGTKWVEGCYCLPNSALKGALNSITKNYKYVLIDSPAGLEHLNRRIATKIDDIFDVLDPSKKSFNHVKRALRIAKEVQIDFKNFYIIGGYRFPEDLEAKAREDTDLKYLGKIAYDKNIEENVLLGRSLFDLPSNSPAYLSVTKVMEKAGYTKQ